jgi:hypothetical protein
MTRFGSGRIRWIHFRYRGWKRPRKQSIQSHDQERTAQGMRLGSRSKVFSYVQSARQTRQPASPRAIREGVEIGDNPINNRLFHQLLGAVEAYLVALTDVDISERISSAC